MHKLEPASWADLPPPLLELILERLPFVDYLRFPAVCPSWRDEQQDHRLRHAASPRYQLQRPWMMFIDYRRELQFPRKRVFYNPSEKRYYRISFPTNDCYSEVSNHGWFYSGSAIINLFSGSRIPIPLPPGRNIRRVLNSGYLLSVPTDAECVFISDFRDYLERGILKFFYQLRDRTWKKLEHQLNITDQTAICGVKFYGLYFDEKTLAQVEALPVPVVRYLDMDMPEDSFSFDDSFLVECDGHILLIRIMRTFSDQKVYKFLVFKADLSCKMWMKLDSLGDHMLFLFNQPGRRSFSLSAVDIGGPPNRIYFWEWKNNDMLIEYDYESHHVIHKSLSHPVDNLETTCLGWIMPSF